MCTSFCADDAGFFPNSAIQSVKPRNRPCRSTLTGQRYTSGDAWRVDMCQSCTCQNGQIICFSQTCPVLSCNKSVLKKGHCCPICISGQLATAADRLSHDCHFFGKHG